MAQAIPLQVIAIPVGVLFSPASQTIFYLP
jgi:hypothetical protein